MYSVASLSSSVFLSTPSVGRATRDRLRSRPGFSDFYPRPPWGGRRWGSSRAVLAVYFYPRPPWGGRPPPLFAKSATGLFLSTPSVGRATRRYTQTFRRFSDFYPRPPWGGRQTIRGDYRKYQQISIHALRGEGDFLPAGLLVPLWNFYPRPPWGGRLLCLVQGAHQLPISIHALRGEGDGLPCQDLLDALISIHALRGEGDLWPSWPPTRQSKFLSTPSVGRATAKVHKNPVYLLRKGYNRFPAGRRNPPRGGKTTASTFNNLAAKC